MAQDRKPTPMARRIVRLLAHTISTEEGACVAPLVQRLQLSDLPRGVPASYTLHLSPEGQGTFLLTCRELPGLEMYVKDEVIVETGNSDPSSIVFYQPSRAVIVPWPATQNRRPLYRQRV